MTQALGPLQEKWLTILESGLLRQGRKKLCTVMEDDGPVELQFCCLGVAEHFVMNHPYEYIGGHLGYKSSTQFATSGLTDSTIKAMCFRSDLGRGVNDNPMTRNLANLNDNGFSFMELARTIRSDPGVYFTGPA